MLSLIMSCILLTQESTFKPLSLKVAEGFVFVESNRKVIFATDKDGNVRWVANNIVKLGDNSIIIALRNSDAARKTGIQTERFPPDSIFITTGPAKGKGWYAAWIFSGKDGKLIESISD